jgi:site-specific recombinase XerD
MASVSERTLGSGKRVYRVLFRHGTKQTCITRDTRIEAEKLRDAINLLGVDAALKALAPPVRSSGVTVDDLARRFMAWKATRDVTPRTLADYQRDYDNWIKPTFGGSPAEDVTEHDVQRWVDDMRRKQLSAKSVADRHMVLHSIYKFGSMKTRRFVSHNPCLETELPPRPKGRTVKGTTMAEWETVLEEARRRRAMDAHDLILFMGSVGWRWSEATALPVREVYDDGDAVWVNVARVFRLVDNRQTLIEDAAKSQAGFRRVKVLNPAAVAMLRRRVVGKALDDYVFTNRRGNHWNQNTFLRDTWPTLAAGITTDTRRPTPHWLRHMAVGILRASGLDLEEIRAYIGHENSGTTTKVYGGMMGGLSSDKVSNAAAMFSGARRAGFVVSGELIKPDAELGLPRGVKMLEAEVNPVLGELE